MRGSHRRFAGAFLLSGSLAFGCLEDADPPPLTPGANGGAGSGGTTTGGAGSGGTANAGAPSGGRSNGGGGATGGSSLGGSAGEASGGVSGEEGGSAGAPAIVNCVAKAEVAQDTYTDSLFDDCRVEGVVRSTGLHLIEFYQQVFNFSKRFWGCEESADELEFDLVFEANALTQADVDLLIELYVSACDRVLNLPAADEAEMRDRLARIAEPVVVSPSEDTYSMSLCEAGTGGMGGAGGTGGAAAGAGGSNEIGGAGGATAGGDGGTRSL